MPRDFALHPDPLPIAHPDTVTSDREVRERAARLIEDEGWWQAGSPIYAGRHCLVLAYGRARKQMGLEECPEGIRMIVCGMTMGQAFQWNDAPGRTKAEVLALLRGTAGR